MDYGEMKEPACCPNCGSRDITIGLYLNEIRKCVWSDGCDGYKGRLQAYIKCNSCGLHTDPHDRIEDSIDAWDDGLAYFGAIDIVDQTPPLKEVSHELYDSHLLPVYDGT